MKILRNLKRVANLDNVEYVENTEQKVPWFEQDEYLLVEINGEYPMLFTKSQIKVAQKRAKRNPEDV